MQHPTRFQTTLLHFIDVGLGVSVIYTILLIAASYTYPRANHQDFWGFLPSLWDHPEPNYIISPFIAEFWSVFTALPLAGCSLILLSARYSYGQPVFGLYLIICWMYSCAFAAHTTLSPLLMSLTLTSVLTNGLYTLFHFGHILSGFMSNYIMRLSITLISWCIVVFLVIWLPHQLGEFGGVPTLTIVQTPAVLLATLGAQYQLNQIRNDKTVDEERRKKEIEIYKLLRFSGVLLISAMAVSFIEVSVPRNWTYIEMLKGFPYFHVTIHVLEQIGIFCYGVGVSGVQLIVVEKRPGACLTYAGIVPYVWCVDPAILKKIVSREEQEEETKIQEVSSGRKPRRRRKRVSRNS